MFVCACKFSGKIKYLLLWISIVNYDKCIKYYINI